ncbi:MAG: DNA-directed RNA polymerase sigma-70 factor [Paracoccaceae bacterium]|nr:MAG: DNA-directed RNA polymerase sigma-70 factor [Paracoccaceae bacterium]
MAVARGVGDPVTEEEIADCLTRIGRGDRAAFARLYDATAPKLFGLCLRVLKDRALAEDALQEAYVRIWQKADGFTPGGASPMGWLVTLTRNLAIDRLRAARRAGAPADETALVRLVAADPDGERVAVARAEARRIADCLQELARERAEALRGAYLDGMSYAALAERFGVPLNTMRSWLRRGLAALRECLER